MEKASAAKTLSFSSKLTQSPVISRGQDGKFIFTTEEIIYIIYFDIKLMKKHNELPIISTEIALPTIQVVFDVGITYEKLAKKCTTDEWNTLVLKRLVPSPQLPEDAWTQKGYRTAAFSPAKVDCNNRSMLATLTLDGNLRLLQKGKTVHLWNEIANLSEMWYTHVRKNDYSLLDGRLISQDKNSTEYEKYVARQNSLSSIALAWSTVLDPSRKDLNKFVILASAMKSGHVVLWKVNVPYTTIQNISLLDVIDTEMGYPSKMCFCHLSTQTVLCVGFGNGSVQSYVLEGISSNLLTITSSPIWSDCDLITVSDMVWCEKEQTLAISKGPYLVLARLTASKEAVQVEIKHHKIGNRSTISGLWYSKEVLFASLSDCTIYTGSLDMGGRGYLYQALSQLSSPGAWQSHGICTSANDAFVLTVQSPCVFYDHLSLKEPVQLKVSYYKSMAEVASDLVQNDGTTDLSQFSDHLMCLTCAQIQGQPWPPLLDELFGSANNIATLPVFSLKLFRILYQMKLTYVSDPAFALTLNQDLDDVQKKLIASSIKSLGTEIMKRHLTQFITGCSQHQLTDIDKQRLSLAKKFYLQIAQCSPYGKDNPVFSSAEAIPEICKLCKSEFPFTSDVEETCPNGHKFARCCQTLLLCQTTTYRVCSVCNCLAMAKDISGGLILLSMFRHYLYRIVTV